MNKNSSTKELNLSSNERLFIEDNSKKLNIYKNFKPKGINIYTFKAGFKKYFEDLLIILFDKVANISAVYSRTSTPSAPIIWDKKFNKGKIKALIVNAGNANAYTGTNGIKVIDKYVKFLSKSIKCKKEEVLVSSTGVIGEVFDPRLITNQIKKTKFDKSSNLFEAAKSIMTTDTYAKVSLKKIKIGSKKINIFGIAKGSGMIMPNMGTMLAYIFIEAKISNIMLKKLLKNNLEDSFNSISVDSDTSTSDTLALISITNNNINFSNSSNYNKLNLAVSYVMKELSLKVVKDGEGISKLIKVNVINSKSKKQSKNIAFSIVNSPLVKTSISGEDANWGRIIMAIGKSYEKINQNKIQISYGKNIVCKNGSIYNKINISNLNKYMQNSTIEITVNLNNGNYKHTVYGNDLTYKYIKINAEYRS